MLSSNIHHQDVENNENCNGQGGLHASLVYLTQKGNASVELQFLKHLQIFLTENYIILIEPYFKTTMQKNPTFFWNGNILE